MIVNFHFSQFIGNLFKFEGPLLLLERNVEYEFAVRYFHLSLETERAKEYSLWSLSSNLVDRSPTNPKQSISYFILPKTLIQGWEPHSLVFYPLEKNQLENPVFFIERIPRETQLDISHAHIQLEIRKCSDSQNL